MTVPIVIMLVITVTIVTRHLVHGKHTGNATSRFVLVLDTVSCEPILLHAANASVHPIVTRDVILIHTISSTHTVAFGGALLCLPWSSAKISKTEQQHVSVLSYAAGCAGWAVIVDGRWL